MKAIFFEQHGGPEVLRFADLPDPEPKPGEALIRVRAVALNHLDIWVRYGWKGLQLAMPHILGSDVAGEVVKVADDQSRWKLGDRVILNPGIVSGEDEWTRRGQHSLSPSYRILGEQVRGGLAEYVIAPIENLLQLPQQIDFTHGAAPILVGVTCWRMLFKRALLQPGEHVLIVGAGGGVNSLALSLCRSVGCTVYALTSGAEKVKRAEELGAQYVIDYSKVQNWHVEVLKLSRGRGVDVVVDNVGQATIAKSIRAAARGGRIVTVGNTSGHDIRFDNRLIFTKQLSILGSTMGSTQDFHDAMQYLWDNNIPIPIDRVDPLSKGIEMLQRLEEGKQFGKIVLTP